jgi:alkylation response protein AidB-like acyl-CoA dehydrogenase
MDLVITEEQTLLQRSAKDFVAARSPLKRARTGEFSRDLWKEMGKLGWLGLVIDEQYGGSGLGHRFLAVVLEELGRGLVPEPLVSTAVLGATAIELGGNDSARREHLPAIAAGERIVALAHQEPDSRFALAAVDTSADRAGGGWKITGEKAHVADGTIADLFVVSARAPDGVGLFLVPSNAKGVTVVPQKRIDARSCAIVRLESVSIDGAARLGGDQGMRLLERVVDAGTVALSAEMLGTMTGAFAMTLDYLKTRIQFGVPIGSFQALQHRAARLFVEGELARSAVMYAAALLDGLDASASSRRAASVAKAKCTDTLMLVALESIQMHGGIGMTDEHPIGLFLKRARVAEMTFGDAQYHRDRFARLSGF